MIGWKADVGYVYPTIVSPEINKMSDITFTDFGVPICIPIFQPNSPPISNLVIMAEQNEQSFYDNMKLYIGDDVNTLFSGVSVQLSRPWPNSKNISMVEKLIYTIPAVHSGYPNLYSKYMEELKTNSSSFFVTFYRIPSLNRLIRLAADVSGTTSGKIAIYKYDGDNLTLLIEVNADLGVAIFPQLFKNTSTLRFTALKQYGDNTDLTSVDSYVNRLFSVIPNFINSGTTYDEMRLYGEELNTKVLQKIITNLFTSDSKPDFTIITPDNPYEPGGPSGPDGGGGSFDDSSDQIVDSSIPTISSANTGFTRIYNPSLSQVQALARYLWTDENVIQTIWNHIKQYFEDPMQAIIGFNLVPVPVPNGGTQSFALMYIDTGVEMTVAASQFVDVDCGTFELKEYYGSALDYAPNTKVSCFLPFIGTVSLNTDEVMGRTLQVKYRVDICSGSCVAKIAVDGNFIYQYSGHCAINIPISSADFSSYVSSVISVAQLAAGAIAAGAGGVMASTAVDATQQTNQVVTTTQITNTARNPVTGRQITTGTMTRVETRESPNDLSSTQASFSGLTPQNISNTVGQIMSSKPNINHSGSFSGNSGYLGVRRPFLIIERPNICMPSNFPALNGFPSMITIELSSCKGFTRVQQVQLTGFNATNPEQAEILQLLKSGVIL